MLLIQGVLSSKIKIYFVQSNCDGEDAKNAVFSQKRSKGIGLNAKRAVIVS